MAFMTLSTFIYSSGDFIMHDLDIKIFCFSDKYFNWLCFTTHFFMFHFVSFIFPMLGGYDGAT